MPVLSSNTCDFMKFNLDVKHLGWGWGCEGGGIPMKPLSPNMIRGWFINFTPPSFYTIAIEYLCSCYFANPPTEHAQGGGE